MKLSHLKFYFFVAMAALTANSAIAEIEVVFPVELTQEDVELCVVFKRTTANGRTHSCDGFMLSFEQSEESQFIDYLHEGGDFDRYNVSDVMLPHDFALRFPDYRSRFEELHQIAQTCLENGACSREDAAQVYAPFDSDTHCTGNEFVLDAEHKSLLRDVSSRLFLCIDANYISGVFSQEYGTGGPTSDGTLGLIDDIAITFFSIRRNLLNG